MKLPEYYSLEESANEVELFYKDESIRTFLKQHALMDPLGEPPLNARILDFIVQNKLLTAVNYSSSVKTNVSPPDPLTYDKLIKAQSALAGANKPGTFKVKYHKLQGDPIILPENWSIVEDPTAVFYEIKLYHYDRLMESFQNSPEIRDDIHKFIKEYEDDT